MAEYKLHFKASVEKDLKTIPGKEIEKILRRIESLKEGLRPTGNEKLAGEGRYRIRQGDIALYIRFRTMN